MIRVLVPRRLAAVLTAAVALALPASWAPAAYGASSTIGGDRLGGRGVVVNAAPRLPQLPRVTAKTWLVADARTGQVLAARGAHVRRPPASTLKALTALAVHPALEPTQRYVAGDAEVRVEGSRVGIVEGGSYTVHQLFEGLFLMSGNDAAVALAKANGGVRHTVAAMNSLARRLGAFDTVAVNPTGLDAPRQTSSAYDLALLGRAVLANPELARYAATVNSRFPGKPAEAGRKRDSFAMWTRQDYLVNYDGAVGIKNGYTTKARNTLIGAARRGDRTILVTSMGNEWSTWREAAALTDWAFRVAGRIRPVGTLVTPEDVAAAAEPVEEAATGAVTDPAPAADPPPAVAPPPPPRSAHRVVADGLATVALAVGVLVATLRARVLLRRRPKVSLP